MSFSFSYFGVLQKSEFCIEAVWEQNCHEALGLDWIETADFFEIAAAKIIDLPEGAYKVFMVGEFFFKEIKDDLTGGRENVPCITVSTCNVTELSHIEEDWLLAELASE